MARNPNTRAEATVTLNSKQAEQVLNSLKQKAKDLKVEIKKVEAAGDGKLAEKLRREFNAIESSIRNVQRATFDYSKVLRNINGSSIRDLEKAARLLNSEVRKLTPGTKEFITASKQLDQVRARIRQLTQSGREHASMWERMTNGFNKYFGIVTTLIASITGITFTLRKFNEEAAKMDDKYADVMKTTKLLRHQVVELNDEFKKLDTRTSREKLNDLARDAGKLGLEGKKNIMDFVDAGNQIDIALGEDLGEGAIKQIGKMVGVYESATKHLQGLDLKGQMLAVGSAVNELGASSTAAEPYLVAFAGRLGGISKQAKISIADILGFASALDQDMQQVEMSATAFQKFIMKLMADPAKFAKMAGVEVKQFTELLKNDTNQAIITVLRSLNEKGGFQQLIPLFKDMGLDGARAVGVLSSMAGSIDKVTEAQTISNKALEEGVSITNEYNIKNTNKMAILEKARKKFKDMAIELGERLNPAYIKFTNTSTYLIKFIGILIDFFAKYGGTIFKLTTIVIAYTAAVKAQTLWESKLKTAISLTAIQLKLKRLALVAGRAATLLYSAAVNLLTGNITKANKAFKLFAATIKANPIGLIVTVLAAAGLAIYEFAKKTRQAADTYRVSLKDMTDARMQYIEQIQNEKKEVNNLVGAITNVNTSAENRIKLINQLKEKYPEYLKFIDAEKVSNDQLLLILNRVNSSYGERFKIAALQGKSDAYSDKIVEMETRRLEIEERLNTLSKTAITPGTKLDKEWKELNEEDKKLDKQIKSYTDKVQEFSDAALKMKNNVERSFSVDGIKDEIANLEKHIDGSRKKLAKASSEQEKKFYQDQIDELERKKILLETQVKLAEDKLKKTEPDENKSTGGGSEPDLDEKEQEKLYKKRLAILEAAWNIEKLKQQEAYLRREITHKQYLDHIAKADQDYYTQKADLEKEFGKSDAESRMKALEHLMKQALAIDKAFEDSKKSIDKFIKDVEKDLKKLDIGKALKPESDKIDKETEDYLKTEEDRIKRLGDLREQLNDEILEKKRDKELAALKELHDEGLMSEKEYAKKQLAVWTSYISEKIQYYQQYVTMAGNLQSAWSDAQYAELEAQKEKELSLAGNNEKKRQQIEDEYAQKKLDLDKAQADTKFRIQVAQIIASTALAIMQGYAQLGPIGGSIAAVMLAATGVMQIKSASAEREKVKAMTLQKSGGSSDSSQRVLLPGLEKGGSLTVEREQDGKLFNADLRPGARGYVSKPTVLVGESGNEFVANNDAVRNPSIKPVLDIIDIAQKHGTIATLNLPAVMSVSKMRGRESGGSFTTSGGGQLPSGGTTTRYVNDPELVTTLKEVKELLTTLKNQKIRAYLVYSDLEKAEKLKKLSDELGNLK